MKGQNYYCHWFWNWFCPSTFLCRLNRAIDEMKKWMDKTDAKTNDKVKGQSERAKITTIIDFGFGLTLAQ